MTYTETVEYLYNATPQFQRIGAAAYKPGLDTACSLDAAFGHPHRQYPCIHVAGTNGKGSTCHSIAAILQAQGLKVGLYTSPHLADFRERIRINGEMIPQSAVVDFVSRYRNLDASYASLSPSFFELTTIMAFDWFARQQVDIAIIEVGLGGRLDTTNIITPILSIITNISLDHVAQLGDTVAQIATEKAGIIKPGIPVVIGNSEGEGVREVFTHAAESIGAPIHFASDKQWFDNAQQTPNGTILYTGTPMGDIIGELSGDCQPENMATILCAIDELRCIGWNISDDAVCKGAGNVSRLTGLAGRWMRLCDNPLTICDTGHNVGGWQHLAPRLESFGTRLTMIIGFVNDKDVSHILNFMPRQAHYIFTQASIPRAMAAEELRQRALSAGLSGEVISTPIEALKEAQKRATAQVTTDKNNSPVIFIGGSTFVVADILSATIQP